MLDSEARLLAEWLSGVPSAELSPVINLGSSSAHFRKAVQPQIDRLVMAPLERAGIEIVHVDLIEADGVDIAGDIFDADVHARIRERKPKAVLCSNMLEHVPDREALAARIDGLLEPGGLLIVTAPRSYPFHPNPIDTMYRPSPQELAVLFPDYAILHSAVVAGPTWLGTMGHGRAPFATARALAVELGMGLTLWRRTGTFWKAHCHRFLWAFRRFEVSAVMLRKPGP